MKRYVGLRSRDGCRIRVVVEGDDQGGEASELPLRLDLCNHSPTGFEWGYGGSGPAQTALALLADVLQDDQRAVELHELFKWDRIAGLPGYRIGLPPRCWLEQWEMGEDSIREWADTQDV